MSNVFCLKITTVLTYIGRDCWDLVRGWKEIEVQDKVLIHLLI